jgi:excisionase family DNA binding protein
MPDEWLTTTQAAQLIGYHPEYVRQLVKAGKIEAQKIGRDWLIQRSKLLAYIRKVSKTGAKRGPKTTD